MLDHLIATNKIEMAPADVLFIKDLIAGEKTRCEQCVRLCMGLS